MSEPQVQAPQTESEPLCFYCQKNPAAVDSAYLVRMSRTASITEDAGETGSMPEEQEIAVPRCADCAAIHQRLHRIRRTSLIVILGVGIGGGLLMNLVLFGFQLVHPGGILFAVIVGTAGLIYLVLAQRFGNPNQVRTAKTMLDQYPPIKHLKEEGWRT